jgi:hypothetical protein
MVYAASWPVRPRPATCSDGANAPENRTLNSQSGDHLFGIQRARQSRACSGAPASALRPAGCASAITGTGPPRHKVSGHQRSRGSSPTRCRNRTCEVSLPARNVEASAAPIVPVQGHRSREQAHCTAIYAVDRGLGADLTFALQGKIRHKIERGQYPNDLAVLNNRHMLNAMVDHACGYVLDAPAW